MRVFISSTCYDLIDVRAELAEQLKNIGIAPFLSDDKLSDFKIKPDVNSIESCLSNVDSCDELILILDKRYGATLEKAGYEKISATHLEYRRAIEKKMPIRVYVRNRLDADYVIWKRNERSDKVKLSWINEKDKGLFSILDEHIPLQKDTTVSNWYSTFTNSIDLKAAITKHFEKRMLPQRLIEAIQNNNFPLIDIEVNTVQLASYGHPNFKVETKVTNVSSVPAFNFKLYWVHKSHEPKENTDIFSSGKTTSIQLVWNTGTESSSFENHLIVEYESSIGITVWNKFHVSCRLVSSDLIIRCGKLIERKFRRSLTGLSIEIEADE